MTETAETTPRNLRSITSLPFFAALFVVLHHTFGPDNVPVLSLGYLGVTFFFVLSGFVLTWSDSAKHGPAVFYRNRLARIMPLNLLTLAIAVFLPFAMDDNGWTLLQNLTLTQAWTDAGAHSFNWVSWSISVEALFYLLFPLVFLLLRNRSRRTLLLVAVAALVVQAMVGQMVAMTVRAPFFTYDFPPYRLPEFVIGICLGFAMRSGWRLPKVWAAGVYVVAGLATAGLVFTSFTHPVSRDRASLLFLPVVAALIYAAVESESRRPTWLTRPALVRLGQWSFALYMVHMIVIRLESAWLGLPRAGYLPIVPGLLAVVLAVALSGAAAELVEKPFERVIRGHTIRSQRPAPAVAEYDAR